MIPAYDHCSRANTPAAGGIQFQSAAFVTVVVARAAVAVVLYVME